MFRLYSKGCEYAIRALLCVVPKGEVRRFQAAEICKRVGIPEPYTRKVFQALVRGGFLRASRGPGGGYELTRDPRSITLLEVIRAVDGDGTFDQCVMGLPQCGSDRPCPLHPVWSEAKEQLLEQLARQTLEDLSSLRHCDGRVSEAQPRKARRRLAKK
ncbi:MAG: Rrf2 family transcriptional regulator [Candidatus Hydrogenedentes bacterium]|nr:Rrf2 family transcriptional regulator [Candidatus Hydrogenedentota bacterium]